MPKRKSQDKEEKLTQKQKIQRAIRHAEEEVFSSGLLRKFKRHVTIEIIKLNNQYQYGYVREDGHFFLNYMHLDATQSAVWQDVIEALAYHLAFDDFKPPDPTIKADPVQFLLWDKACGLCIDRYLHEKTEALGTNVWQTTHNSFVTNPHLKNIGKTPETIYNSFRVKPELAHNITTFMDKEPDMVFLTEKEKRKKDRQDVGWWDPKAKKQIVSSKTDWVGMFAQTLVESATRSLETVHNSSSDSGVQKKTKGTKAKSWFLSSFPMLGAIATAFKIEERPDLLRANQCPGAMVEPLQKTIYINSREYTDEEVKFLIAHEILHIALRDDQRLEWRDFYLWNCACDFRINSWLLEMQIGHMPVGEGSLYDPEFKDLSAEAIYDIIVKDLRKFRKIATLRGCRLPDVISPPENFWQKPDGCDLDDFYRSLLAQGYDLQTSGQKRGYIPASLIDELKAQMMPPIPWDVKLAKWFDVFIKPIEKQRTFSRASRRQCSTPDIPRPSYYIPEEITKNHTFGIVFDTSASMSKYIMARGLGTIVSYSQGKDVKYVRLVYADAMPYDKGYVEIEELMGNVKVQGRGGTILQPAINLLEKAKDFPKDAPILIITDGWIDRLKIKRAHGYLIPRGNKLPYRPEGEIFFVE